MRCHCCPLSLQTQRRVPQLLPEDGWEAPEQSPFGLDKDAVVDMVDGTEDVDIDAETGDPTVRPRALPTPKLPSADIVAHHILTHIPYRPWCPYCCAGRRPNSHQLTRSVDAGRTLPIFHADGWLI